MYQFGKNMEGNHYSFSFYNVYATLMAMYKVSQIKAKYKYITCIGLNKLLEKKQHLHFFFLSPPTIK